MCAHAHSGSTDRERRAISTLTETEVRRHAEWPSALSRGHIVCVGFNEATRAPPLHLTGRAVTFWWYEILKIHTVSAAL